MDDIKPALHAGVISAEVPDPDGKGSTQLIFEVHRNAVGLDPRVTVTTLNRSDRKNAGEIAHRAMQLGQAWLLALGNTTSIVQLDDRRRSEAKTKPVDE